MGDIDHRALALSVLNDDPLTLTTDQRRLIVLCLLIVVKQVRASGRKPGRPRSSSTARRADKIARDVFIGRAFWPRAKHKGMIRENVARLNGVSAGYVDTVLRRLAPGRRRELQAYARAQAAKHAEWLDSPVGRQKMRQWAKSRPI